MRGKNKGQKKKSFKPRLPCTRIGQKKKIHNSASCLSKYANLGPRRQDGDTHSLRTCLLVLAGPRYMPALKIVLIPTVVPKQLWEKICNLLLHFILYCDFHLLILKINYRLRDSPISLAICHAHWVCYLLQVPSPQAFVIFGNSNPSQYFSLTDKKLYFL